MPFTTAFIDQFSENIRRQIGSQRPEDQPDALVQYLRDWLERSQQYPEVSAVLRRLLDAARDLRANIPRQ
ncbi:hypothetical protein [Mycobacterium simiae]|uniref:hypothetical protein n=1 Tax=Mycobacterium simiae TaxID=1784 RepID=UPI0004105288|nr:hypothetical protein [Mycobacterium simiae]BBX39525.1 hypothetical protein MSIM_09760 [Mycobacterium simiae]